MLSSTKNRKLSSNNCRPSKNCAQYCNRNSQKRDHKIATLALPAQLLEKVHTKGMTVVEGRKCLCLLFYLFRLLWPWCNCFITVNSPTFMHSCPSHLWFSYQQLLSFGFFIRTHACEAVVRTLTLTHAETRAERQTNKERQIYRDLSGKLCLIKSLSTKPESNL